MSSTAPPTLKWWAAHVMSQTLLKPNILSGHSNWGVPNRTPRNSEEREHDNAKATRIITHLWTDAGLRIRGIAGLYPQHESTSLGHKGLSGNMASSHSHLIVKSTRKILRFRDWGGCGASRCSQPAKIRMVGLLECTACAQTICAGDKP